MLVLPNLPKLAEKYIHTPNNNHNKYHSCNSNNTELNTDLNETYVLLNAINSSTIKNEQSEFDYADQTMDSIAQTIADWADLTEETTEEYYTTCCLLRTYNNNRIFLVSVNNRLYIIKLYLTFRNLHIVFFYLIFIVFLLPVLIFCQSMAFNIRTQF